MKLIIFSQKVDLNDDNLGFFHLWLENLSEKLEKIYVIGLAVGEHKFSDNVVVYSLGKEKGYSKLRQFFTLQKILLKHLRETDGVFTHMCPIYGILCFPLTKLFKKKLIQWYAHGAVTFRLRLVNFFSDKILTSSLAGFRIKSKKVKVIGQGIDTDKFNSNPSLRNNSKLNIVSVGRISEIKDQVTLIKALDILINKKNVQNLEISFIGDPVDNQEKKYFEKLKNFISEKNLNRHIKFLGGLPYNELPNHYQKSDLLVNTSSTGSLDKVVLEAMASGCLVLTCNQAYEQILEQKYRFEKGNYNELANKIFILKDLKQNNNLREIVTQSHSLNNLTDKIINQFKNNGRY